MRRTVYGFVALTLVAWLCASLLNRTAVSASSNGPAFVEFESGHVRPIAMSADGSTLFAVNTPNGTLEIFDLTSGKLNLKYRVPVGLEPVAVAARNSMEIWVTNLLSDSVSVVTLTGTPHVIRTLLVGDEPRDIYEYFKTSKTFPAGLSRNRTALARGLTFKVVGCRLVPMFLFSHSRNAKWLSLYGRLPAPG